MVKKVFLVAAALTAALVLATPALAGGWATVTLDVLPGDVQAGETLRLTFMVRQHGVTPTHGVSPFLTAQNAATGETLRVEAQKLKEVGHFEVAVTFPSEGVWEWQIDPGGLAGTSQFEPLTVLPAGAVVSEPAAVPAVSSGAAAAAADAGPATGTVAVPGWLRWVGLALIAAAGATAVLGRARKARRLATEPGD